MGLPLEAVTLSMDDIQETTDTKLKKAAVAEFKLSEPLKISDKPFFLVTIEGFGTDPSKENFRLYIDVKPVEMDEAMAGNLLAHNSYCRLKGEDDYLRPINYYGGQLAQYEDGVLSLSSEGAEQAVVYNVGGEKVVNAALDNGQADVHVHLAKGIYLVRFMKGGKVSGAAKLLCNE